MLLSSDEQDFHVMLSVDNTSEENVGIVFFLLQICQQMGSGVL
jgi:hypothetical protein